MRKIILIIFILTTALFPQSKSQFDINEVSLSKISTTSSSEKRLKNNLLDITLISGGYFTVGTVNGLSTKNTDDLCAITYGHPFAKTSYPLISVKGKWYKLDEYFSDSAGLFPSLLNDTLRLSALSDGLLSVEFLVTLQNNKIKFIQRIVNLDSISHNFGTGLVFDPALGKWGDGVLSINNNYITDDSYINLSSAPYSFALWEKQHGAKGIGVEFNSAEPLKIIAANWKDAYKENEPVLSQTSPGNLYDLDLKIYFNGKEVPGGDELINELEMNLVEPDFSSKIFTRWDLPNYFDLADNLMFPRDFNTYAEVSNHSGDVVNCNLDLSLPTALKTTDTELSFQADISKPVYQNIYLQSNISYEDMVVEAVITIKENNNVIDELHRNVFIPATPVSDSGLVIVKDSLSLAEFPKVDLVFSVEYESSGARIFNLRKDDIFLYEDDIRFTDFTLEKYKSDGAVLADIVFVLDVSGSMGNEIQAVINNIGEFADSLVERGYDYQIGVVTFSTTVDNAWDFTNDIQLIKQRLSDISLWGGVEDSPAALYKASELSFRTGSKRTIIWVTDEEYPENTYTKTQVVNRMLSMDITVHGVGLTSLQTNWFDPIVLPTGGNFYDINGNFRDVLLDVSRLKAQDRYLLSFQSKYSNPSSQELKIKVHYAGLGAVKTYTYNSNNKAENESNLKFYPNPFNPEITFLINNSDYVKGEIRIFNILGECVKSFHVDHPSLQKVVWNARNDFGFPVSTGFYVVQLMLHDAADNIYHETAKILYLK